MRGPESRGAMIHNSQGNQHQIHFFSFPKFLEARLQHPTPAAHRSKRPGVRMSWRVLQNYVKQML